MRADRGAWRTAALVLAAASSAIAVVIATPPDAIGSPRRMNVRAPAPRTASAARTESRGPILVRVAEIGVGPASGMTGEVRDALVAEAAAAGEVVVSPHPVRGGSAPVPSRFALRAAVTQFERQRTAAGYRVRCAVSILVEESPGGRVRMVLSGRATSEGEVPRTPARARSIESAAVRGAVRSALRHVTRDALLALR